MSQEKLEKAVEAALKADDQEQQEQQEQKATNVKAEEKKETQETNEDDEQELDARTTQALQLLAALEDPRTAKSVVENLARQAGILSPDMTKQEQKQAIKSIRDIVKEKLGDNGAFIANELGAAIEEVVSSEFAKIREEIESVEARRQAAQLEKEFDEVVTREKLTNDEANALMKLADEMPWNGRTPLNSYLTKLIKLHRSEVAEKARKEGVRQQQQKNIQGQTKTQGVESNEERVKRGSAKISVQEAVLAALRGESLE